MEKFVFVIYDSFDFSVIEMHLKENKCIRRCKKLHKEDCFIDWVAINMQDYFDRVGVL